MADWKEAKAHLNNGGSPSSTHATTAPRPTLAPRQDQEGESTLPGGSIYPTMVDETTSVAAVSSGTSTAMMADNTPHTTKWVCKQPYNIPVNLGEGALASVICTYIFPFLQNLFTGPSDTVM